MTTGYPDLLALPCEFRSLPVFGRVVSWSQPEFQAWPADQGRHRCDGFAGMTDTYGCKPVLLDTGLGEPLFAEKLIVHALTANGHRYRSGGWVDVFRSRFRTGVCRVEADEELPIAHRDRFKKICGCLRELLKEFRIRDTKRPMFCRGTWDVVCWGDLKDAADVLFVESKGPGDDFAKPHDFKEPFWLEAALRMSEAEGWGWTEANFRVLEWSLTPGTTSNLVGLR